MTREHRRIRDAWVAIVRRAIALGDADAAYRLTVALVRRLRELAEY
jgi:uncharacterized protein (DUF2267 family)